MGYGSEVPMRTGLHGEPQGATGLDVSPTSKFAKNR
jgi:hypothetical protein